MSMQVPTGGPPGPRIPIDAADVHAWLSDRDSPESLQEGIDELRLELGPQVAITWRFDKATGAVEVLGWSLDNEGRAALALAYARHGGQARTYFFGEDGPALVQSGGNPKTSSGMVVTDIEALTDEAFNIGGVRVTEYLVEELTELAGGAAIVIGPRKTTEIATLASLLLFHDDKYVAMVGGVGEFRYVRWRDWPDLLEMLGDPRINPSDGIPGFIAAYEAREVSELLRYYLQAVR